MTQESIISKVHKLLKLAGNNTNAQEAAAAAAKAQALIDEYNLSETMLQLDNAPEAKPEEPVYDFYAMGSPLDSQKTQQSWRQRLAVVISRLNGCRVYISGGDLALVGRPSDAETVRYLYGYLTNETNRLTEQYGRGMGVSWRNNFRLGVVDTVSRKLHETHKQFENDVRAQATTSMALVRVNTALAKIEQKGKDVDSWISTNLILRKGGAAMNQRVSYNGQARATGRRAGESITIGGARGSLTSGNKALKGY